MKRFLLVVFIVSTMMSVRAQKGVENGTAFGSGEDSIRCRTNISLFVPYAKSQNYADAYEPWKLAYEECPGSVKDIYLYGVRIISWQIANENDPAKKKELVAELMKLYDNRIKYFAHDKKYGKDWIMSRKAQDYIQYEGDALDPSVIYGWLGEVLEEYKEKSDPLVISLYMFASHKLMSDKEENKGQYVADFLKCSSYFDAHLEEAKKKNDSKEIEKIEGMKSNLEKGFAGSGAADCETMENIYTAKIEENKTDLEFLRETITLLRRVGCQESECYFAAARYAYQIEPTAESAQGLGRQALKKKEYSTAENYFNEAISMMTENNDKADLYFALAAISFDRSNFAKARGYCQKAIEANANFGAPYMLIGNMYAATAGSIYPNDPVLRKAVYYVAVDKFERARAVDPSVAGDAAKAISSFRSHFPSTEEIFMHPDLEKGKPFTVGGWIGERTTVR